MRLEKLKLSPELYDFSPEQKLLIKSRLYFYREGVGLGSKTVRSWRKIASDISNLAELPDLSVNEKNIIKERYQYYLITQSRRGKNELSDKEIIEGAFNIGADSLNRWYLGQNNRQKPGTKKPYQFYYAFQIQIGNPDSALRREIPIVLMHSLTMKTWS